MSMLVAPYSPSARAKARTVPASMPWRQAGMRMRQNIYVLLRPSVCPDWRKRRIKALERAARRAVHQWESNDRCCKYAAIPRHDEFDPELHEEHADRPLRSEHQQQKIAAHRRRKHHGQCEDNVQHTFYGSRQLCGIIRKENAREKYYYTAYSRYSQRVYKRIPVNIHTLLYSELAAHENALPIQLKYTYATLEKPTDSNTFIAASLCRYSRNAFAASACFAFFMTAAG